MKAFLSSIPILILLMVTPASAEEKARPAPGPMPEEAIRGIAMIRKIEGPVEMPEETLEERALRINRLIRKLGYSEKQLKVTVDPSMAKSKIGFIRIKDARLIHVFQYTFDARRITMKITTGRIKIITMDGGPEE
ncbi:hypothetical protein KBB96_09230 [Luteolibacter ambystomatis]|uniref:POTRA domain-containing protein n=1 Tax=Luteolibacter ambystomatis TaxID=2824561 RepID=A0A975J2X7_9BACT|nr:hypothetical protein [Luteolibacter ambystomatis]QUE53060.1 hypothetical protein KBB96_09230 [Luteolibacter ambystomatis]